MTVLTILPMQANQVNAFAEIWIPWLRDTMKVGEASHFS
jgi:hypothetical protein